MSYKVLPPPTPGLRYTSVGAYCLTCERRVPLLKIDAHGPDGAYTFRHGATEHVVTDWPY